MGVFALDAAPTAPTVSDDCTYLGFGLQTLPSRKGPDQPSGVRPPLPSMDYRYLHFNGRMRDPALAMRVGCWSDITEFCEEIAEMIEAELPIVSSIELCPPLSIHADELREYLAERGLLEPRLPGRPLDGLDVCFNSGQVLRHRRYHYRGVILGQVEPTCNMSEAWIRQMGVDQLPRGRLQPWYHVLVDQRDRPGPQQCYVCHDSIELSPVGPIDHPEVRHVFGSYDAKRGRYLDRSQPPPTGPWQAQHDQSVEDALQEGEWPMEWPFPFAI